MRRLVLSAMSAAAFAATTSAQAADLPVKAPPVVAAPVWNWTGFYLGGNAGYGWGDWKGATPLGSVKPGVDGWFVGVQAGYNWQVSPIWVVGLEGDFQVTGQKASQIVSALVSDVPGGPPPFADPATFHTQTTGTLANEWKMPWFATFRGRIGALVDPTTLIYGTAGLAVANVKGTSAAALSATTFRGVVGTTTNPVLGPIVSVAGFSESNTQFGWTAGGGVEKKFTPNWSAKAEYLYLDLGKHSLGPANFIEVKVREHIARVGVNYQFR